MDLDALLGLLFFVVFVVLPMITGARKRGQGRTGPQQGAPGQGRTARTGQGTPAPRASGQRGAATTNTAQSGDHPASATLEEIRRRVQEAQERERQRDAERSAAGRRGPATAAAPSRGLVASDPFEGQLVSRSAKSISGESLGREGAAPAAQTQGAAPSGLGREGTGGLGRMTTSTSSGLGREGATNLGPMLHSSGTALGREGATGLGGPMPSSSRS